MTGHMCPECGGEQGARPRAGCACGAGAAARAGREARAAEIAAAEDFDPLRIRPYVTLNSDDTQDHGAPGTATTMPLFLDGAPGGAPGAGPVRGAPPGAAAVDGGRR
ncbi:MAG TPA: peptidoglycan-binding protein, partial [Streptomyces sp.]|nr:peptidoglycan-binding protein [Streptomyces sp.]